MQQVMLVLLIVILEFNILGSDKDIDSINFVNWQFRNTTDPNLFCTTK